jgi:hypothetical protein
MMTTLARSGNWAIFALAPTETGNWGATKASRQCIEPGELDLFNCDSGFHQVGKVIACRQRLGSIRYTARCCPVLLKTGRENFGKILFELPNSLNVFS